MWEHSSPVQFLSSNAQFPVVVLHESFVQRSPSLQAFAALLHRPVVVLQSSEVQALLSLQSFGAREHSYVLDELMHRSNVHALLSVQLTGVKTQTIRDARGGTAWMTFTVEVGDASRLAHVLGLVSRVPGVRAARRK